MSKKYRSRDYHGYLETVKTLPTLKEKWEYTWENWNALIIGVAFGLFFVVTMAISVYNNSAPVYLNGAFVNIVSTDQVIGYQKDYLEQAFLRDYLGIPEDDRTCITYNANLLLGVSGDEEEASQTYYTTNQLDILMASHEIDYFLMQESLIDVFDERYEGYWDLRDFLTEAEMELYADRLHYNPAGVPTGINITDTEIIQKLGLVSSEPVYLVWCLYVEDPTHMRPFFDFVMSSLT